MTAQHQHPEKTEQEVVLELTRGFQLSQCLFTATALNIPDLLKNGAKSCAELAQASETHSPSLYRLLRVLASIGIVNEIAPQQFETTPLATCLQEDSPDSLKDFVLLRAEQDYLCWHNLAYSIKTGKSAFEHTFGMSRYRYNQQTPQLSARFDHAMSALAEKQKNAILESYAFSKLNTIVDIAGGQGSLLISILTEYPHLNGILFDLEETIQRSKKLITQEQLESRCQTIAGSFFDLQSIPIEKDLYILKHVLHNWDDEQALTILKNCRQVMRVNTTLLIIEGVISPKTAQRSALLDLHLLVSFASGKLRTEAEFNQLLQHSGFQLTQIIATQSDMSIIEAQAI